MFDVGRHFFANPARLVLAAFSALISVGTALLVLPICADPGQEVSLEHALFFSTSATTVTGFTSLDIATFSLFGEIVLLVLVQVGGFGVMTIGSVVALAVSRRVGLRQRVLAQAEIGDIDLGELRSLLAAIARITIGAEALLAVVLFVRLWQAGYEEGPVEAAYSGLFHAVTAFNNAGLALYSDNMMGFVGDPFITLPMTMGFIVGGLGFPVMVEMYRRLPIGGFIKRGDPLASADARRRATKAWTLHTRITVGATVVLLIVGPIMIWSFEWTNPETLGPLNVGEKLLAGWFQGVTPRTAGFNTIDITAMNETSLFGSTILMFIGAGPASTGGGIKVTTAAVLAAVIWAEIRGEPDVNIGRRRLPTPMIRASLTVALLAVGLVVSTSLMLMASDGATLTTAMFEIASAFGTVGLSSGLTGNLTTFGNLVLIAVMFCGRVGTITFTTAFVLRSRSRLYRYPEERPIIG